MWNNLEHQVWNKLKSHQLEGESVFLLAVSGGLDSMVLQSVMQKIRPRTKLILMHYHHGPGENLPHRDAVRALIQRLGSEHVIVESESSKIELKSESDFREARLQFFERIKSKYSVTYYLTGHHLDDVFETRLLKLIRGTGLEGLEAFQEWNAKVFRPLLAVSKAILKDYALERKVIWVEDPTNQESDYLRNWIRNIWLPQLAEKVPGALGNMSQSLQNILDEALPQEDRYQAESARYVTHVDQSVQIDKAWFFSFNVRDQLLVLIRAIKESFSCDFSTSQIKEVIKRLDKNQNDHIFEVAGLNWVINAQSIVIIYKGTNSSTKSYKVEKNEI